MPRVRQFSAQRHELSHSRLYESRKIPPSSTISNSRVQKYQIATPTSNKRHQNKRQSTGSRKLSESQVSQKSSSSQYICTGCFNQKLASDKKQDHRKQLLREKQEQKNCNSNTFREDHEHYIKHTKLMKNIDDVREYNNKIIQEKQNSKFKQLQQKHSLDQQQKSQNEEYLNLQKQIKIQKKKTNEKLLKDIQEQINYKQLKHKKNQDQQHDLIHYNSMFGTAQQIYFKEKARKQHEYRQELLRQIQRRQIESKKQQALRKNIQNLGVGIAEAAYQRQLERQKIVSERQQSLLEEARKRKEIKEHQFQEQRKAQKRLQKERIKFEEEKIILEKQFSQQKKRQVQHYLQDIQKQIQVQKKKREKQVQDAHELTNSSIEIVEKTVDRKNCNSCEKQFSKTFLTKLK